jgi:hypothetical protein
MSYIINWSSQLNGDTAPQPTSIGKETITIVDSTTDSSTSLTLTGKNWSGYGAIQQENFIRMMENFASEEAPTNPTVGQLWYNTAAGTLSLYVNTTANPHGQWEVVYDYSNANAAYPTLPIIQATAPTPEVGVFWYNTTTNVMSIYTGSNVIAGAPPASGGWTPIFNSAGSNVTNLLGTANQIIASSNGFGTVTVSLAPNTILPAPTSGTTLTIIGAPVTNTPVASFVGGAGYEAQVLLTDGDTGNHVWALTAGSDSAGGFGILDKTNGVNRVLINTLGQVTIYGASSGTTLIVDGDVSSAGTISAALFSGSGASLNSIPNGALVNSLVTVAAGFGLAGGGTISLGGTVTLTNAGVTRMTSGSAGISFSAATGAVTAYNTGVTSINAGGGISISGATGSVTVTNTGVTSLVGGTNISVSAGTGAISISVTGTVSYAQAANTLDLVGAGYATFNWSGQSGQPTWLLGSNSGTEFYVWNPANFNVNYANSAGSASNAIAAITQAITDNSTNIATTAFVHSILGSGVSLAGNGYVNFTSGLQLRWGAVSHTVGGAQAHSFSTPFSTGCFVVIPVVASSEGVEFFTVVAGSETASGWQQYSNNTTTINYVAIGH